MSETAQNLSDVPAINKFLSLCRIRKVPQKTVVIHAGDLPDILYYIVDGSVEVMIEDEDGNESWVWKGNRDALIAATSRLPLVLPLHPRGRARLEAAGLGDVPDLLGHMRLANGAGFVMSVNLNAQQIPVVGKIKIGVLHHRLDVVEEQPARSRRV